MAASADEGEEDLEPGFSSDEYEEGTTSSAAPEHVHGNSPQLAPEQRQRIELQKRRAIALRAQREHDRAMAAAAAAAAVASTTAAAASTTATAATASTTQHPGKRRRTDGASSWRKDTQAGFFLAEEDDGPSGGPREAHTTYQAKELAPEIDNPFYPAHPKCSDCGVEFWNSQLQVQFGVMVCDMCHKKHKDGKYSLVTKTAAKADYLLREADLGGQPDSLRFIEKYTSPNRRNEKWSRVKLYLLSQVEAKSFALYGSEEGLDKEFDKREATKRDRSSAKQAKEMRQLRKDTLTARWMREPAKHEHTYGDETHDTVADTWSRVCEECGYVDTYEKM